MRLEAAAFSSTARTRFVRKKSVWALYTFGQTLTARETNGAAQTLSEIVYCGLVGAHRPGSKAGLIAQNVGPLGKTSVPLSQDGRTAIQLSTCAKMKGAFCLIGCTLVLRTAECQ